MARGGGKGRIPVGGRNIPGMPAQGARPSGSGKVLATGTTPATSPLKRVNEVHHDSQTSGGGGVGVNSQPV